MNTATAWLAQQCHVLPQPWLERWGLISVWVGWGLVLVAFSGLTLSRTDRWRLSRLKQRWDGRAFVNAGLAMVATALLGHALPFVLLPPGDQWVESIKSLCALVSIVLFGYPALLALPGAILAGDLITGRPMDYMLAWPPAYLMLPAYLWLAVLALGKRPDFRQARSWGRYLLFGLLFLVLEPPMWPYFLSQVFTPATAYRHVLPAALMVHGFTVLLAPLVLALALPAARRLGIYWRDMPGHAREVTLLRSKTLWASGEGRLAAGRGVNLSVALGLLLTVAFLLTLTLRSVGLQGEHAAAMQARRQAALAQLTLLLPYHLDGHGAAVPGGPTPPEVTQALLKTLPAQLGARAYVLGKGGGLLLSTTSADDAVLAAARRALGRTELSRPIEFELRLAESGHLPRALHWQASAAPCGRGWTLIVATMSATGVPSGDSNLIAIRAVEAGAMLGLVLTLSLFVSSGLRRLVWAGANPGHSGFLVPGPHSALRELDAASSSFNRILHELERRNERLELATRAGNLGVWECDLHAGTSYRDAQMGSLLGLSATAAPDAVPDAAPWAAASFDTGAAELAGALQRCRTGQAGFDVEVRVRWPGGELRDLRLLACVSGQQADAATPWRVTGVCGDITERKATVAELGRRQGELEALVAARTADLSLVIEQLNHATRAKTDFLAYVSHEIRTPVNAISGLIELMQGRDLAAEQRAHLLSIRQASEVLLGLVDDVLDLAKIEAGRFELDESEFKLAELLENVVGVVGVRARQKGLALRVASLDGVPTTLIGDAHRLRQVLLNLCSNAVKFTAQGEVSIGVSCVPAAAGRCHLRFAVRDSGMGITPEQRQRLFQPFRQADASIARRYGGTGLGLTISMQLVTLMGGAIDVESHTGAGSEFFFTVELQLGQGQGQGQGLGQDEAAPAPDDPASGTSAALRGRRALVVDDDELNRLVTEAILTRVAGMEVQVAEDGSHALAMLRERRFDIVVTDMQMPHMHGSELARAIRSDERLAAIPILALSAEAQAGDREGALAAGISDYLVKPVRTGQLLAAVQRLLEQAQAGGGR